MKLGAEWCILFPCTTIDKWVQGSKYMEAKGD